METSPLIRDAELDDIPAVLALWQSDDVVTSRTDDADALRKVIGHPTAALIVAERADAIIGSLIVGWDGWRGELYRLAVMPAARREGVATALVRAGERRLLDLGARRISVLVLDEAEQARGFWLSVGYELNAGMSRYVLADWPAARLERPGGNR